MLEIRPFRPSDQDSVRELVLAGLGEHFGVVDETANPDMDDVDGAYIQRGHAFSVAIENGELVGTVALMFEGDGVGRVARMSVRATHRRNGIGRALVNHVSGAARTKGLTRLVLETTREWEEVVAFYERCGFVVTNRDEVNTHMVMEL